jgi:hypothetical protein
VSRACIDVKSDGNITRALPLLSSGLNVGVRTERRAPPSASYLKRALLWRHTGKGAVNFIAPLCTVAKKLGHPITQRRAPPSASYWKGRSQFHCAAVHCGKKAWPSDMPGGRGLGSEGPTVRLSTLTVRALFLVWHRLNERGDASDYSAFI